MEQINLTVGNSNSTTRSSSVKSKKKLTDLEIIQAEEKRKQDKLNKMAIRGEFKLTLVKIFNEAWNQGRSIGIQRLIETWEKEGQKDPVIENLKMIFNRYGAITILKLLNSSYLNEVEGCVQLQGRKKTKKRKIKYSWETKEPSKEDIKKENIIRNILDDFIKNYKGELE